MLRPKLTFLSAILCLYWASPCFAEASSVERLSESLRITLDSDASKAEHQNRYSFTIHKLDAEAEEARWVGFGEGSVSTVTDAEVRIDRKGKTITKFNLGDFEKMATPSGSVFINQDTQRLLELPAFKVGDIVHVEYKEEIKPFLGFSIHTFLPGANESRFQVTIPTKLNPQYKLFTGAEPPTEEQDGDRTVLTWTVTNLEELPEEDLSPPLIELYPSVSLGVDRIAWGPADTWENLAGTYWVRAKERLAPVVHHDLKPRQKGELPPLTAALELAQNNLRYTAVFFGLDGYIPHDPNEILRRRYGDCKDMATLIWATTPPEVAKVNLAAVLTRGFSGLAVDPLPTMHFFNHMVAHVDEGEDGRWLDATASYATVANPRSDIQGSPAMIATGPNRGYARIPVSPPEANQIIRNFQVTETQDRSWFLDARIRYLGVYAQNMIERAERGGEVEPVMETSLKEAGFEPLEEWEGITLTVVSPDEAVLACQSKIQNPTHGKPEAFRPTWDSEPYPWNLFRARSRTTNIEWPFLEMRTDSLTIQTAWSTFADHPDTTHVTSLEGLFMSTSCEKNADALTLVRQYAVTELTYPASKWKEGRALRQQFQRWSSREVFQ
ncbi:MAG: DUF3857 domain-containing protein [Candidatus Eisenbacteria bacterium]|uniref:DUF3857 domain-containing protein n=1 Tax=Eiseniibacteriota bacterium TaxID=2212470 RepID=A0A7Y2H347_UNCEI|nr:DUF3857 domain-containing protein [Candidatus Eisenbacteria bacterium]